MTLFALTFEAQQLCNFIRSDFCFPLFSSPPAFLFLPRFFTSVTVSVTLPWLVTPVSRWPFLPCAFECGYLGYLSCYLVCEFLLFCPNCFPAFFLLDIAFGFPFLLVYTSGPLPSIQVSFHLFNKLPSSNPVVPGLCLRFGPALVVIASGTHFSTQTCQNWPNTNFLTL